MQGNYLTFFPVRSRDNEQCQRKTDLLHEVNWKEKGGK